jgi:hypothetical protein
MFKFITDMFVKKENIISEENNEDEMFKNKTLDEKVKIVSELFAEKLKNTFDFDEVLIKIEDQNAIDLNLILFEHITNSGFESAIKTASQMSTYILESGMKSFDEQKIVIFLIKRKYGYLYEKKIMIGCISEEGSIFFDEKLNNRIFGHFKWDGRYKINKEKESFCNLAYYVYNHKKNELTYVTDIILDHKLSSLNLRPEKNSYFPNKRAYLLSCSIIIDKQNFSLISVFNLTYKDKVLRSLDFNISGDQSFYTAIDRMLFPFNLDYAQAKELDLNAINISEITNLFEDKYKLHKIIEI